MHRCLHIVEIQCHIFAYCASVELRSLALLARTCRAFQESALDILWRDLDDISPLIKCLPSQYWKETKSATHNRVSVTDLEPVGIPQSTDWHNIHVHASRVQKVTLCHQRYTENGSIYRISWSMLAAFGKYVRKRPGGGPSGALFRNLRILSMDYCEHRAGKYYVTECFPYIAGQALSELRLRCDSDTGGADHRDLLDLSRVIRLLPATSPDLQHIIIHDLRQRQSHDACAGLSYLLGRLKDVRQYISATTLTKEDIANLAAMPALTHLSIALHMELAESPFFNLDLDAPIPFNSLESLVLDVKHLELAIAFIRLLDPHCLTKLQLTTTAWHDESTMERCLIAIARHDNLRELAIYISPPPAPRFEAPRRVECALSKPTLMKLFTLPEIQSFVLAANDRARFETDIDDQTMAAMAMSWPHLRSLTIVQGDWTPHGVILPTARTTVASLLALRNHCPDLHGLSISLDTNHFEDRNVLHAVATNAGDEGTALEKLNIGSRSTRVSNHSVCAQVLKGLFPNLTEIHDGSNVAWDKESSDWQEVGAILRRLSMPPREPSPMMICDDDEFSDEYCE